MAVRTLEELLGSFRSFGIDENNENFIKMLEDMTDSYGHGVEVEEMKRQIAGLENDLIAANQRYIDRFYNNSSERTEQQVSEVKEVEKVEVEESPSDDDLIKDMEE